MVLAAEPSPWEIEMQVDSFALPREMQERSDPPLRLAVVNALSVWRCNRRRYM
jgi:hypothetical protein